jgi:hypothetical protein
VTLIATMNNFCPVGPKSEEAKPEVRFSSGISEWIPQYFEENHYFCSYSTHFDCIFKLRSKKTEGLLRNSFTWYV